MLDKLPFSHPVCINILGLRVSAVELKLGKPSNFFWGVFGVGEWLGVESPFCPPFLRRVNIADITERTFSSGILLPK